MNFKQSYNQEDFLEFVNDFLPGFEKDIRPVNLSSSYKAIKKAKLLGRCEELDLTIFELQIEGKAEKKVYQAKEGFRLMRDHQVYTALAVYYSEQDKNWRLSLMQMIPEKTDGGKITQSYSNPRRFSFYLGPDAKTKTPEKFLKEQVRDIDNLVSRFDVEVVTKEFFTQYKNLFIKLLDNFREDHAFKAFANRNSIQLEIFTKKILGQIVFIYFLQRKGWVGAQKGEHISKGDKNFLRTLFQKSQETKESFFNEYLEPLFYDCLNKEPELAGSFYRSKFEGQVPFLNGGLFEPINNYNWKEEFLNIPNEIFSNTDKTGILDVFDVYNFTVNENTPDDQEVSVDPEMLGKVFENLIEENIRKGQGAFYTPREIVQYMCQESLINYLNTKTKVKDARPLLEFFNLEKPRQLSINRELANEINDALKHIKIVDPACGSGAFLIGILQLIVPVRSMMHFVLNENISNYHLKKETIENCIYGVDIDPGAIDIAKLRFWLSIVVDEDIDGIEPLPNLDYKLMQGNSLLEDLIVGDSVISFNFDKTSKNDKRTKEMKNLFEEETQTRLFFDESETLVEKMEKLHAEYFNIHEASKKKILKNKIDSIEDEIIKSKCQEEISNIDSQIINSIDAKKNLNNTQKLSDINNMLNGWSHDHLRPFFPWRLHFGEVFNRSNPGFDIVIANPPYGSNIDDLTSLYARIYPNSTKHYKDIYKIFIELALSKLLSANGSMTYIIPNTLLLQPRYKDIREYLLKYQIIEIINLGENVFEQVVVPTCVVFIKRADCMEQIKYFDLTKENKFIGQLKDIKHKMIRQESFNIFPDYLFTCNQKNLKDDEVLLDEIFEMKDCGIKYQRKNVGLSNKGGNDLADRIFYNSCAPLSDEDKQFLIGKDLSGRGWYVDLSPKRFLRGNYKKMIKQNETVYFNKLFMEHPEKIIWRQTSSCFVGTILNKPIWIANTLQAGVIKEEQKKIFSAKYLLALLNSKYLRHVYSLCVQENGRVFPQVKLAKLRLLPIKKIAFWEQEKFAKIVDNLLNITRQPGYETNLTEQEKARNLESVINEMVYKLYSLTPEEIKNVEEAQV